MTAAITAAERHVIRHALGLPPEPLQAGTTRQSYRNHYRAPKVGEALDTWRGLQARGLARCQEVKDSQLGPFFHATREGAEAALEPGELLCPEDFPLPYKPAQETKT